MRKLSVQIYAFGFLFFSTAHAAELPVKNSTALKVQSMGELWGSRKVDMGVATSMVSGEFLGVSFESFILKPHLKTKLGRFDSSLEVPFVWSSEKRGPIDSGSRDIGRPVLAFVTEAGGHQVPGLKIEMGGATKLPMLSTKDEFSLLNKAWAIQPAVKVTKGVSGRLDVIGGAELEISRAGKINPLGVNEIRFEKAPEFQLTLGVSHRYDQALKLGAMTYFNTSAGRHKISGGEIGKTREVLSASRDRISLGAFADYQTTENTKIQLGLRSSLKNEDTLIGALIASENPEKSGKLATSLSVSRTF